MEIRGRGESHEPRYDIPVEEIWVLSQEFIEAQASPEMQAMPYGCYVVDGTDRYSNLARWVEKEVFYEYFKNDANRMNQEYGPYEHSSTFFMVMDHGTKQPISVMRIIENSEAGLKSLVDLPHTEARSDQGEIITPEEVFATYGIDPNKCVDIATAAVLKEWRGTRAGQIPALLLYRSLYLAVLQDKSKFTHVVSIMDTEAKRGINRMHMPFKPILGSKPFSYLDDSSDQGSLSEAIWAENHTFYPTFNGWQRRTDEKAQRFAEVVELASSVELEELDEELTALVQKAERQRAKCTQLALGMRLLMDGKDEASGVNIDILLAPQLYTGEGLPFKH